MKNIILLIISITLSYCLAQKDTTQLSPDKYDYRNLRTADKLVKMKSYYNAIDKYKEFYQKYPTQQDIGYKLGFAYFITRDYKNAVLVLSEYLGDSKIKKTPPNPTATAPARVKTANGWHRVQGAVGPERLESGWWRGQSSRRDYYRIITHLGCWWWIYRDLNSGEWFLHGIFD